MTKINGLKLLQDKIFVIFFTIRCDINHTFILNQDSTFIETSGPWL
jgi:hypothetical protein